MSIERSSKDKIFNVFAIVLTNQFWIPSFYRYMSTQTVRKNLKVMLLMILGISLLCLPFFGLYGMLLLPAVATATLPYILLTSSIDPMVAWLRGGTDKPWPLFRRVLALHTWAIISPIITILLAAIVTSIFGEVDLKDYGSEATGNAPVYLIFTALIAVHLYFALKSNEIIRKEQKVISGLVFVLFFLSIPAGHVLKLIS
jgi:uncharacterized membrane protein